MEKIKKFLGHYSPRIAFLVPFEWLPRIVAIVGVSFLLIIGYGYFNANIFTASQVGAQNLPLILAYTTFFNKPFSKVSWIPGSLEKCKYKCIYSEEKSLYSQADVAIFHERDLSMDTVLYTNVNPNRLNVFFTLEATPNEMISDKRIPKDFFNLTATFRRDSDVWMPYDKFDEILPEERNNSKLVWTDEEVDRKISKKSKLALQFVSKCDADSKRERYLAALKQHANLTIYGKCNKMEFPRNDAMKALYDEHFFYLAFENAVCDDYVTEKFWRIKNLIVPVVLKRSILKGIVEDEYFIAADDFDSPKALIDRLEYLTMNPDEYKKYFGWTKKYKKTRSDEPGGLCKLCEMATKKEKHSVENIQQWWEANANCTSHFGLTLLKKN